MRRNRKMPRAGQRTTAVSFDLPADRAFVLHLDVSAQLPRRMAGRIEHVMSGRMARITSSRELVAFLAAVLCNCDQGY